MSALRWVFLAMFSVVCLGIVAFTVVVLRDAFRSGGAVRLSSALLRRMARGRAERAEANRWAFLLHRITGFAVLAFLCLHVLDVGLFALSASVYDDVHALYGSAVFRVFECGLLVALLFHALNGLRIVLIDVADLGPARALRALQVVVLLTLAAGLAGSVVILEPVFS